MSELVRAAGLLVYRKDDQNIKYLLLRASYEPFHWTPPKYDLIIILKNFAQLLTLKNLDGCKRFRFH